MRIVEGLIKNNQKKEENIKRTQFSDADEEDDMFLEMPHSESLNQYKGVFYQKDNALNTQESVFDRTAVFRTNHQTKAGGDGNDK